MTAARAAADAAGRASSCSTRTSSRRWCRRARTTATRGPSGRCSRCAGRSTTRARRCWRGRGAAGRGRAGGARGAGVAPAGRRGPGAGADHAGPAGAAPFEVDPARRRCAVRERGRTTALLVGPGLRPGAATAALVAACWPSTAGADAPRCRPSWTRRRSTAWRPRRRLVGGGRAAAACSRRTRGVRAARWARPVGADGRGARRRAPGRPPPRWGQVVVLKGARTVVAAPDGAVAHGGRAEPRAGHGRHRATCSRARSGRCSRRAWRRGTRPGSASTSTRPPASTCASGWAMRACWPRDLLLELPRVRRHLARLAERQAPERRPLGFALRRPRRP